MKIRLALAALSLSAAGLVSIVAYEGWAPMAKPPLAGDVPTVGFGATRRADGSPVRAGDTLTPPAALALAARQLRDEYEPALRACIAAPLTQGEYDAYTSLAYNIGTKAFCASTLVRRLNSGDYTGACAEILRWKRFRGRDCSQPRSGCAGLWARRQAENRQCLGG